VGLKVLDDTSFRKMIKMVLWPDLAKYSNGSWPLFLHLPMNDSHFGYKQKLLIKNIGKIRPFPLIAQFFLAIPSQIPHSKKVGQGEPIPNLLWVF
jgi:hypothetical protein